MYVYLNLCRDIKLNITENNIIDHGDKLFTSVRPDFFGFRMVTCVTYDPPGPSDTGFWNQLMVVLRTDVGPITDWVITLHGRGYFLPGTTERFGNAFLVAATPVDIPDEKGLVKTYLIARTETKYLNSNKQKCAEGRSYRTT